MKVKILDGFYDDNVIECKGLTFDEKFYYLKFNELNECRKVQSELSSSMIESYIVKGITSVKIPNRYLYDVLS